MHSPIAEQTVLFNTLGCRLNFFESDGLFASLSKHGYRSAKSEEHPEVVIINTCTVTNKADSKNRNTIRNAIKKISRFSNMGHWLLRGNRSRIHRSNSRCSRSCRKYGKVQTPRDDSRKERIDRRKRTRRKNF
ncbi:MiaB-like protein [Leptospira interrogans]|nr:MiaB-like protein [Leptospira interrogans]